MKSLLIAFLFLIFALGLAYAVECKCGDEGVTLTVVSGCKDWKDATECSGWASVAHANGKSETEAFPDKTQLTAFECTIQINCPGSGATNDGGTTVTEEKKGDDSGFCSILMVR
ncbi:MAG: hypothetical protein N3B13_02885 [Deltaproteobacteria bacterium]|nr:hypothetical protein [Deltaproteobacteria bacterium]